MLGNGHPFSLGTQVEGAYRMSCAATSASCQPTHGLNANGVDVTASRNDSGSTHAHSSISASLGEG